MNQILNRFTGTVIAESADLSIRQLALQYSANLRRADLSCADLSCANLSGANLSGADLSGADLSGADLSCANLSDANLSGADLSCANLSDADLICANLSDANLSGADLICANLSDANLSGANLSCAIGLKAAADYLSQFEQDELGIIVYKRIGNGKTQYPLNPKWVIASGEFLIENPHPDIFQDCGCGVNFGTLEWCQKNYKDAVLWKCRIRWIDLADVVVPQMTDGKARCRKLELLEEVGR